MASNKKIAQDLVDNFNCFSGPKNLIDILVRYLVEQENMGEIIAFEKASDIVIAIEDQLSQMVQQKHKSGIIPPLQIITQNSTTILIGTAFNRPNDSDSVKKIRETIPSVDIILNELYSLEPISFEKFCSKLLKYIGASQSNSTKSTGDDGVDFIARFEVSSLQQSLSFIGFESSLFFYVYGQAKRYEPSRVIGPSVIRELIGAMSVIKYDEILGEFNIDRSIRLRLCDPIQLLLLSTGKFSPSAKKIAESTGVILKDGRQLATYIAINRIGFKDGSFSKNEFLHWLEQ